MLQTAYLCYPQYPHNIIMYSICQHPVATACVTPCMMPVMVGAVGWRRLCYDEHVHVGLTRSQQPMTIGDTSHVVWQANDGEGRSVGPHARTLWCSWLETSRRDAPLLSCSLM